MARPEVTGRKVFRRLRDRYPTVSRATLWRWRQDPEFPAPDLVAGGTEFFTDETMDAYDAHRTARKAQRRAGSLTRNEATP